jgi:hypothetical protein
MNNSLLPTVPAIYCQAEQNFEQEVRAINIAFGQADTHTNKAFALRVEAGRLLIELRTKVEAEGKDWWPWFRAGRFVRGRKDAEKVIALAQARDPEAAAEEARERNREQQQRSRANRAERQPEATADVSGDSGLPASERQLEATANVSRDPELTASQTQPSNITTEQDAASSVEEQDDYFESPEAEVNPENYRVAFLLRADQARRFAVYSGPITREILDEADATANVWAALAGSLRARTAPASTATTAAAKSLPLRWEDGYLGRNSHARGRPGMYYVNVKGRLYRLRYSRSGGPPHEDIAKGLASLDEAKAVAQRHYDERLASKAATITAANDGLDIPANLRRTPKAGAAS